MEFSPFNGTVWALFLGFVVLIVLIERVFSARNRDYPGKTPRKPE